MKIKSLTERRHDYIKEESKKKKKKRKKKNESP